MIVELVKKGFNVKISELDFTRKEVNILGSRNSAGCFPEALELLASGKIPYPEIASRIPLREEPGVFGRLHKGTPRSSTRKLWSRAEGLAMVAALMRHPA